MAGITKVPATFDEFLDAIAKTTMDTNKDGKTDIYGYGLRGAGGGHEHLGNFLYPYGATWADLTTPQAVQAYKAYLDIFKKRYAPEASVNWAFAEMTDGFQTGLVAMIIHHIGSNSRWQQAFKDDVDAFPVPGGPGGRYTVAGDTELVVYNKSKNKDAAFLFYRYMVTGEGGTTWFKKTGKGLGTQNVRSTPEFQNNRFQAVAAESLKFAGVLPPTDTLAAFANSVWANTNQQALLGKITPEEALAVMQRAIHGK
jgi:multiple sugar transport system substrate-binding protein